MDDREPVNESGDKTEDNDDSQDSVQANPERIGNQTIPPLRQVSPEDQELLSGISEASASSTRNRNINQLDDLFRSSRHLRISTNCSLLADALLSPRYYSRLSNESGKNFSAIGLQDSPPVRQGQSGHRDLPSGTEASSSQNQDVVQPEEALVSNRQDQRVPSMADSEHSNVSSLDSNEGGGSLSAERRGSDYASPLQSSSVPETKQIPQPRKTARKSCKEANTSSSASDASEPTARPITSGRRTGSDCASPLQSSSVRATSQILGLGVRARKTVASSRMYSKTNTALAKRSAETSMGSISAETELSESESGESFESKPSPSAAEGTLDDSSFNAEAPGARIAGQEAGTSRKRERESSSSSENEGSRRQRKIPAGEINAEARGKSIADQEAETSRKRERESSSSSENEDSRRQRKIPAGEIDAEARGARIADQEAETSRKRERESSSSSDNEDSRRQRKIPSGERPLNEESSFSIAERTLDNSPISIGASTGREQSEVAEPYLDIGPGQPSGSGHQPLISANSPARDLSAHVLFKNACLFLRDTFIKFEYTKEEEEEVLVVLQPPMSEYIQNSGPNWKPEGRASLCNKLRRYLADRQEKWLEISQSLSGMELVIRQTYENCMRILVQLIIAISSPLSNLCYYHVLMLNYRNFAHLAAKLDEFSEENNVEDVQDVKSRCLQKIRVCFDKIGQAFQRILEHIKNDNPDFITLYWDRLLDQHKELLD